MFLSKENVGINVVSREKTNRAGVRVNLHENHPEILKKIHVMSLNTVE